MGWSATAAACDTLHSFRYEEGKPTNVWTYKGHQYFYDLGEEQEDGSIIGDIYRELPPTRGCQYVGVFHIGPDGNVIHAPYGLAEQLGGKSK